MAAGRFPGTFLWLAALLASTTAPAEELAIHVTPVDAAGAPVKLQNDAPIVVWLSPSHAEVLPAAQRKSYKMVQKNKQFTPHLLVIPVGSEVSFPNLDPFFHNVFSLFNGRKFDLGLYETGGQRSVVFPREGISYIFCNIHPEMGAVIISLATPYFTVGKAGTLLLPHVPPGDYVLHAWSEEAIPLSTGEQTRAVSVKPGAGSTADIRIAVAAKPAAGHLNKFGEPYPPSPPQHY